MLPCPACGTRTDVKDTRTLNGGRVRKRRRECPGCGNRFSTAEKRRGNGKPAEASGPDESDDVMEDRNEAIRKLYREDGLRQRDIGDAFGLTRQRISQIVNGVAS